MKIYTLVFSPIEVNTYIIADESGDCVIIDCGCYDEEESERLVTFIESKNLRPLLLLNTHCHLDHIFGNSLLLKKYNLHSRYCELEEKNRKNATKHAMLFGLSMEEPPGSDDYISHGDIIRSGSVEFKALHVPGHSAGSLAFYCEKERCVFTGDALFSGSIGRSDLPGGNYETLITSIKENLLSLPPDTIVYPGHGPETTVEKEMRTNPYLS
jgi:hydroxyacylglutathione hydrolase